MPISTAGIYSHSKRDFIYTLLAGFFITNALLAELIGGKLFEMGPFALSLGVLAWPVVFVTTDLVNEYFGKPGVRRLTFITAALIVYAFVITLAGMEIPAVSFSPVSDEAYRNVFGQSLWIMVGSLVAFVISQLVDVVVFWAVRHRTQGKWLWLRSTGSTLVSQLVDTYTIMGIAFWLPGKVDFSEFVKISTSNYLYKGLIALAMTPVIYGAHKAIDRFIGEMEAKRMVDAVAKQASE